ncbi:hypothetical protein [Pseudodesulfovibrio indicus]|uniref:hypothetical protein n=1 Tax=Pseudodesulfovibrio indicus TaxID=1716143 RepID=UPI00292DE5CA|nr:hypothetical protein [Pseudodesulfovibrio indicus]
MILKLFGDFRDLILVRSLMLFPDDENAARSYYYGELDTFRLSFSLGITPNITGLLEDITEVESDSSGRPPSSSSFIQISGQDIGRDRLTDSYEILQTLSQPDLLERVLKHNENKILIQKREKSACLAGEIFNYVCELHEKGHEQPSFKKAYYALERGGKGSISTLKKAKSLHKDVLHLCAAHNGYGTPEDAKTMNSSIAALISLSRNMWEFGCQHHDKNGGATLLDQHKAWEPPKEYKILHPDNNGGWCHSRAHIQGKSTPRPSDWFDLDDYRSE